MARKVKFGILFLVVFLVGGLAGVIFTSFLFHRVVVSPSFNSELYEIAVDARQLSQGETKRVLERKVSVIPSMTKAYYNYYYKFLPDNDSRYASLWQVQRYYEVSGDNIPAKIKPILESLPKRLVKSCELKRNKDSNSPAVCEPK